MIAREDGQRLLLLLTSPACVVSLLLQVVNLIRTKLQEHRSLETAVRDVTAEALAAGSVDNVSVVVLAFHQKLKASTAS